MDSSDVELFAMAAMFDESPVPDQVAEVSEEAFMTSDVAVPMLMMFSEVQADEQDSYFEQEVAFAAFSGEALDVEADVVDQPVRMHFAAADADIKAEVALFDESGLAVPSLFLEDTPATEDAYVTFTAFDGEVLDGEVVDGEVDVVDEPVRMRFSATEAVEDLAGGGLAEVDMSAEVMLYSAMGPSPWQNLDNPDDVNVDGWTTPFDALLVINQVNEGRSLSAWVAAETSLRVDVNGDRSLDANDAIQVINTLNGAFESDDAADVANRVAPLWYDGIPEDDSAWQDTDSAEPSDTAEGDASPDALDTPLPVARLMYGDESLDSDSLEEEKPDEGDDGVFSEDVDWLLDEVL
jgi:hypothetical protein